MESEVKKILIDKNCHSVIVDCTDVQNLQVQSLDSKRMNINDIFIVPFNCEVIVTKKDGVQKLNAKAGQILIVFYHKSLKHRAILVDSAEWIENINAYDEFWNKMNSKLGESDCEDCVD